MSKIKIFSLFIFFNSFAFSQENNIVYLGGGGEAVGKETTVFDEYTNEFSHFFQKVKTAYKTTVAFNGGHKATESIINSGFKGATILKDGFTKKNYDEIIQNLILKIKTKKILSGNKLMIFIDSHGAANKNNEVTHKISLSGSQITDINKGSTEELSVSLDSLKELTDLAEKNNIQLAIIDGSCHSGNTLQLANSKTCIISASSPDQYATNFTNYLAQTMVTGKTLEQAFLKARLMSDGPPFPMISSSAGEVVQEKLQGLLPYILYHRDTDAYSLNKIDKYLTSNSTSDLICKHDNEFSEINNFLDFVGNFIKSQKISENKISIELLNQLKKSITSFKKTQDEYLFAFRESGITDESLNIKDKYSSYDGYSNKFSKSELIGFNFEKLINNSKADLLIAKTDADKKRLSNYVDLYQKCQTAKNKILNDNKYKSYFDLLNKIKKDERLQLENAINISENIKKLYDQYYIMVQKSLNETSKAKSDACKDFVI